MKYLLVMLLIHCISFASNFNCDRSYSSSRFSSASGSRFNNNSAYWKGGFDREFSRGNVSFGFSFSAGDPDRLRGSVIPKSGITQETAFLLKLRDFQKSGNKLGLQHEVHKLQQARIMIGRKSKIDLVNSVLQEPMTDIFDAIKNGSLEQAQAAIHRLFTLSPYKYRCGRNADQNTFTHKQVHYQQKYMYDVLQEAKKLYESREHAPPIWGCPELIGFYTIQPSDMSFKQEGHASDLISTLPSNMIHISPEIDEAIAHRIPHMHESELQNIHELSQEAGATLFDMVHNNMLSESGQCANSIEAIEKFYTIVSKVAQEDVPYFCMRSAMAFKDRITDPVGIVVDQAKGVYAVAKFFCDMNFGRYYMTDQETIEYLDSSIKTFVGITDGLKNLTLEQAADCAGLIAGDLAFNFGVAKSVSYLKEIGALNKANKAICRTVKSLEKALYAETEQKLMTSEGIVVNSTSNLNVKSSSIKEIPKKSGVAPSVEPASLNKIRQAIINRERKITPDDLTKLGFTGEFKKLDHYDKLSGRISLNTELQGGTEGAKQTLHKIRNEFIKSRKLINEGVESLKNGSQRTFYEFGDGSSVQMRTLGKSGHPKIDITDISKNIKEKITFK